MTKRQYEREKLLRVRERELELLAQVRANVDPREAALIAGFWLERQAPQELRGRF